MPTGCLSTWYNGSVALALVDIARRLGLTLAGADPGDQVVGVQHVPSIEDEPDPRAGQRVVLLVEVSALADLVDQADQAAQVARVANAPTDLESTLPNRAVAVLSRHDHDTVNWPGPTLTSDDERTSAQLRAEVAAVFHEAQAAEARLIISTGQVMTSAALSGGAQEVVTQLAQRTNGWAVLLDTHGTVLASAGAGALHVTEARAVVTQRPVRRRHRDLATYAIGSGSSASASLVHTARGGLTGRVRELATQAADLITLTLLTHDHTKLEKLGRNTVVDWLAEGGMGSPEGVLGEWGLSSRAIRGYAVSSRSRSVDLESLVASWLTELGSAHAFSSTGTPLIGLLDPRVVDDFAARIETVVRESGLPLTCGVGRPQPMAAIPTSISQARHAHSVALADYRPVLRYEEMLSSHLIDLSLTPPMRRDLAEVLRPLDQAGQEGADILKTLHAYLAENGNVKRTATRLAIHRHTVRHRIERAGELASLSLDNADDRAIVWLAIKARMQAR